MQPTKTSYQLLIIGVAALLCWGGWKNYQVLKQKAAAEQMELDNLNRWSAAYRANRSVQLEWLARYPSGEKIKDLLTLYELLNIKATGLLASPDTFQVSSVEPIKANERYLGLNKVCVSTSGGDGFVVTADNFTSLLNGLQSLANRKDLTMSAARVDVDKNKPRAIVKGLCMLIRDESTDDNVTGKTCRK